MTEKPVTEATEATEAKLPVKKAKEVVKELPPLNVYGKLALLRQRFHASPIKKSGLNKFAGYSYFELADFIPVIVPMMEQLGLTSVTSFDIDDAQMQIINTENPHDYLTIRCPMASAQLKGCHPIQNRGAEITYMRRYLWQIALEIVEGDEIDARGNEPAPTRQPSKAPARIPMVTSDEIATHWITQMEGSQDIHALRKITSDMSASVRSLDAALADDLKNTAKAIAQSRGWTN